MGTMQVHIFMGRKEIEGWPPNGFSFSHNKYEARAPLKMGYGVGKSMKSSQIAQKLIPREGVWVPSRAECV